MKNEPKIEGHESAESPFSWPKPDSIPWGEGFRLVELLVVIAIQGILAAILLPAHSETREPRQSAYCKNMLGQMDIALYVFQL